MRTYRRSGLALRELIAVLIMLAIAFGMMGATVPRLTRERLIAPCAQNISQILAGMAQWATENDDMIVGSPSTSGYELISYIEEHPTGLDDLPAGPCQVWDWAGPLEQLWGLDQPGDIRDRFNQIRRRREFRCPATGFLSFAYDGGSVDAGPDVMVSYNTSRNFMYVGINGSPQYPVSPYWTLPGVGRWPGTFWAEQIPDDYGPCVSEVGSPACKVFLADGARYTSSSSAPTYTLAPTAGYGGAFADSGPYAYYSRSWSRRAGFWEDPGSFDARIASYRHGTQEPFQPLGEYKMNVGFFDGHVELMDDIDSANPHMWMPTGSTIDRDPGEVFPDVIETWFGDDDMITIGDCPQP